MFDLDIMVRRGDTRIACRIAPAPGLTVLFGPSGIGKTSVLHAIAGLVEPEHGHIRVDEALLFDTAARIDLPPEQRRAGYVFQEARLFPHMRVRANLLYGAGGAAEPDAETLRLLGIGHLLDRWPRTLSGGEARRVAIGRALHARPRFLLLDEPLSSLDRARREEIMGLIEQLRDSVALPILLVTHDLAEAQRLGSQIVEM